MIAHGRVGRVAAPSPQGRALCGGEADQNLGAGQVVVELLRLAFEEQVALPVADQDRAADHLRYAAFEITVHNYSPQALGEIVNLPQS